MGIVTQVIRVGAALVLAFALAVGYSTTASAGVSGASNCTLDPYCHWIPYSESSCWERPCYSDLEICCLP